MILLDGKVVAKQKTKELKEMVAKFNLSPILCIIQIGDNYTSNKYIQKKITKANEIGIKVDNIKFNLDVEENEIINYINLNQHKYDGVIVQLPLPLNLNKQNILNAIDINKDVDGLSFQNMKNFYSGKKNCFVPATAKAILLILNYYNIDLSNKNIVVIGESNLVGKPTKYLLSKYTNIISSRNKETGIVGTENADILVVAAGSPHLIKKENVKLNSIIIDVGINIIDNKIVGDVDFEEVKEKVHGISPVPGGIGPLTVISLLENVILAILKNKHINI